jgi:hypothetical protein
LDAALIHYMTQELSKWLGEVTGYAIELGDKVQTICGDGYVALRIDRRGSVARIVGQESIRRLTVSYTFRISNHIEVTNEEIDNQINNMEEIEPDSATDELRNDVTESLLKNKLQNIPDEEIESARESLKEQSEEITLESDSTIRLLQFAENSDLWDGFEIQTFLYPTDERYGLREYDQAVQQVISHGATIGSDIYNTIEAISSDTVPKVAIDETHHDRAFQ